MENEYWFGDVALIDADTRFSNAQIIGDATLLVIPRTSVQSVGERWPALYKGFFVESSNRISQLFDLMGGMLFYPLRVRLAGRILELIRIHGEQKPEGTYLNVNLSQNDFARLSLGSRQRINKIFREWNEQGIIQMRNDQYFIESMEALEKEIDVQHL
jgi:CRP-like cAMP-binding protein